MKSFLYYLYTDTVKVFFTPSTIAMSDLPSNKRREVDMRKLQTFALKQEEWELGVISFLLF